MTEQTHTREEGARSRYPLWIWFVPVVPLLGLAMAYFISPKFYLDYILHTLNREHQLVEIVTFTCAFVGGLMLVWAAKLAWQRGGRFHEQGGAAIIGVIAAASLFFAGEEISWGQSYLGWNTPESMREFSGETNLHNSDLPVNSLGSVFLIVMFFALPFVWHLKWPRALPANWECAIAEGPVVFSMGCAFSWRAVKNIYRAVYPDYESRRVYVDFLEQLNEHKEMVVAISLLMYAVFRIKNLQLSRTPAV